MQTDPPVADSVDPDDIRPDSRSHAACNNNAVPMAGAETRAKFAGDDHSNRSGPRSAQNSSANLRS